MLKIQVPANANKPIVIYGAAILHPVDANLLEEALGSMEHLLRVQPGIITLSTIAKIALQNKISSDRTQLLCHLAEETGKVLSPALCH